MADGAGQAAFCSNGMVYFSSWAFEEDDVEELVAVLNSVDCVAESIANSTIRNPSRSRRAGSRG